MYRIFAQNLNNYFLINKYGDSNKEFRLKIAQVLRGMADKTLYEEWAANDIEKYYEINNLVYEIQNNKKRFHTFESFAWDLWGYGYKAEKSNSFASEVVEEQLKLIDLLLGTQYWFDVAEVN